MNTVSFVRARVPVKSRALRVAANKCNLPRKQYRYYIPGSILLFFCKLIFARLIIIIFFKKNTRFIGYI